MKKLIVAALAAVTLLVTALPAHAYTVLGHKSVTYTHNSNDYKVCFEYWATDTWAQGVAQSCGTDQPAKVLVDYVYLWKKCGDGCWNRVAGNEGDLSVPRGNSWIMLTPQYTTSQCWSGFSSHPVFHSETRFRLTWRDGSNEWHDVNSFDQTCIA